MAGSVHHHRVVQPQHINGKANKNNMYIESPYYGGHGFYYNPVVHQNIEALTTPQCAVFNGLGVSGNGYSSAQPPVQYQKHCNRPYSANRSNGSATWVQVGPNPYYMNRGTQTIQGDVIQRGTFNGRGKGARLCGHFSVSGDIN
ncbi:uncharacterized protein LOC129319419 [Prosopis cineraria]|uniref:uncharacterized protein LOC129319419 n=1 Tax=Prosopis cineraria TaxID=364024 RepID=UPI00240EA4CA|nr:uncharacterized protein LOC129319419 [Prosopis cineraria]